MAPWLLIAPVKFHLALSCSTVERRSWVNVICCGSAELPLAVVKLNTDPKSEVWEGRYAMQMCSDPCWVLLG